MAYREPEVPPQWQRQQQRGYPPQPGYGQPYQQDWQAPRSAEYAPLFQPGYQEPPQSPPPPQPHKPPQGPKAPRRRAGSALLAIGALIVGVIIGHATGSSGKTPGAAPAPAATVTVTSTPTAAAKAGHVKATAAPATSATQAAAPAVIATFTGSGIQNTAQFTAPGTWKLNWSYDCSSFGSSGNFIVDEDGGNDLTGASVNELGSGGSGSTMAYNDAGTHYLSVNSECSWRLSVIDEG